MQALIHWIMGTSASKTVANVAWVIPAVQTIHILAISVVISTMAMLDLRLMGLTAKRYTIRAVADRFLPWMWSPVIVLLITGLILITGEPDRALGNWVFQTKMALLIAVLAISWGLQPRAEARPHRLGKRFEARTGRQSHRSGVASALDRHRGRRTLDRVCGMTNDQELLPMARVAAVLDGDQRVWLAVPHHRNAACAGADIGRRINRHGRSEIAQSCLSRPFGEEISREVLPWTWTAFVVAAVCGGLLFSSAATKYYGIATFRAKILLLGLAGINMLVFHLITYRTVDEWGASAQTSLPAKISGGLSLLLWAAIVALGRWTGFA